MNADVGLGYRWIVKSFEHFFVNNPYLYLLLGTIVEFVFDTPYFILELKTELTGAQLNFLDAEFVWDLQDYEIQCRGLKWIFDILTLRIFAVFSVNSCFYGLMGLTFITGEDHCDWTTYHLDDSPLATWSLMNELDFIGEIVPYECR